MYKLLLMLLLSFTFTQEPCEGTCLSEEQAQEVFLGIKECEFKLEKTLEIETNLNLQIKSYIEQEKLNQQLINDYKKQLALKDEVIKVVKPKWYDNKYLWFFGGVIITGGAVHLAGQID
tara:strand:+ start:803 stop:1159 length:357 start_codon:yes stop_codon:yes gene_type:complete